MKHHNTIYTVIHHIIWYFDLDLTLICSMKLNEMEVSLTSHKLLVGLMIHAKMNDMDDGPAWDLNPQPHKEKAKSQVEVGALTTQHSTIYTVIQYFNFDLLRNEMEES